MGFKQIAGFDELRWRHIVSLYIIAISFGVVLNEIPEKNQVFVFLAFLHMILAIIATIICSLYMFVEKKGGKW